MYLHARMNAHRYFLVPLLCYAMLCSGNDKGTRGTAYVVFEDIYDAKQALEHLGGFNVQNRYLILQVNGRLVPRRVRQ